MKTIVISFDSAKLPIKLPNKDGKDKINEFGITKDRTNFIEKTSPIDISYKQISNVIHVLCGCRPAPTCRQSFLKRISGIDDIAKTAFYKIDNAVTSIKKDGSEEYIAEFTEGKKSPWNSHSKSVSTITSKNVVFKGRLTWSSLYKRYGIFKKDSYKKMLSIFERIYWDSIENVKNKYSLVDFLIELRKDNYDKSELISFLDEIKCTPIKEFIKGNDKALLGSLHTNVGQNLNALCNNTAETFKICLNGKIVFFINEDDVFQENVLKLILEGTRHATFFDGGLISVESIFSDEMHDEDYVSDGYIKVNL